MLCGELTTRGPREMNFGQVLFFVAFTILSSPAYAIECTIIGPRYRLASDTVNWSIKIGSGQSCIRGLRFSNVAIETLELVSPPQTGQVKTQGPSFTYSAKSEYEGDDSFTIAVTGSINRSRGSSSIRIIVSVGNPASTAILRDRPPRPITAPKPPAAVPVDNNLPLPENGSLP